MTYATQYALINKCEAIEPHERNKAHNSDFNLDNEYLDMRTKCRQQRRQMDLY